MIEFWIAAALLSALAAALVLHRAARLARQPEVDPTVDAYRRQLGEIDDLAERGLLAETERRSARTEAARRLLTAAGAARPPGDASVSRPVRLAVLTGAVAAPLLAVGLYMALGSPGLPDQPFAQRLAAWRAGDPTQLGAAELAAVLQDVVKARPADLQPRLYLARAQAASGDLPSAIETLRSASRLAPLNADVWVNLGEALAQQAQGAETPQSIAAFRQAVAVDPKTPAARYHLARAQIMAGDLADGLAGWRALAADLPAANEAKSELQQQIAATAKAGRLVEAQTEAQPQAAAQASAPQPAAAAGGADQQAFIQSMVDALAAQLKANPQDPQGWARLIRSYGVIGQTGKQTQARAEAQRLFKDRPEALKAMNDALSAAPTALPGQ